MSAYFSRSRYKADCDLITEFLYKLPIESLSLVLQHCTDVAANVMYGISKNVVKMHTIIKLILSLELIVPLKEINNLSDLTAI